MGPTATDYKNAGNKLCASNRYDEAIGFYSKAIVKNPKEPSYFSNRALCYLKLEQHSQAIQDCRRALELNPDWLKAHLFLGTALNASSLHEEALRHLQRAHDLAKENRLNFGDDITYQIRLAKRRRWNNIDEEGAKLEEELFQYLTNLIKRDKDNQIKQITDRLGALEAGKDTQVGEELVNQKNDRCEKRTEVAADTHNGDEIESNVSSARQETRNLVSKCDIYMDRLETVFKQLKLRRKKREVPDHLCGKISFEIMRDPVITPSGVTYDRENIEEHLYRVGFFDPITRQPLTASQLIPNLAMKEVIDAYLTENEWANYC